MKYGVAAKKAVGARRAPFGRRGSRLGGGRRGVVARLAN